MCCYSPSSNKTGGNRITARVDSPTTTTGRNITVLEFRWLRQPVLHMNYIPINAIVRVRKSQIAVVEGISWEEDRSGRIIGNNACRNRRRVNCNTINGTNRQCVLCIRVRANAAKRGGGGRSCKGKSGRRGPGITHGANWQNGYLPKTKI